MLMPSIFGENLFDDFFDMPFRGYQNTNNLMKTDVKENEAGYEISIALPGVKKENIQAELKDGYLTVNASSQVNNDEKDENDKYIRRERYVGKASRSFYVGDYVTKQDIKAKYEDGILTLDIPKIDPKNIEEKKEYIAIEG